jgi:hypothetical protein
MESAEDVRDEQHRLFQVTELRPRRFVPCLGIEKNRADHRLEIPAYSGAVVVEYRADTSRRTRGWDCWLPVPESAACR